MDNVISYKCPKDMALQFVEAISKFDFDIDIQSEGRNMVVDAKSLMAVLNLDLKNPLRITLHTDDEGEVTRFKKVLENLNAD